MKKPHKAAPIIVVSPNSDEAEDLAGWLRGAGLGAISTVHTCDEAIFIAGRGRPPLLIVDDGISDRGEQRLMRHFQTAVDGGAPPLVRLTDDNAPDPFASGRAKPAAIIHKPLLAHDVVVRVGTAMHRPDLLGRLDESRDHAAQHLEAARQMQIGLLPTAGALRNIEDQCGVGVAALYRPGEELGGDFWGVWPTGQGRFALALADFAGHGLSAALNTFRLHLAQRPDTAPRQAGAHDGIVE